MKRSSANPAETTTSVHRRRRRRISYVIVGGWNTVFGWSFFALLYLCCGRSKAHYLLLSAIANEVAIINAYLCYKFFVFRTRGWSLGEMARFHLVYILAFVLSLGLMGVLVSLCGLPPVLAQALSTVGVVILSYIAHTFFSFATKFPTSRISRRY